MRIVSMNVGQPRELIWDGEPTLTGIYKEPVEGRVMVRTLNVDGDQQADLKVHGGIEMAVYGYPWEHYAMWQSLMPDTPLGPGSFGENLTTMGLSEDDVHVGDRLRVGDAELVVTKPRQPCFKLAAKLGRPDIVREMLENGMSGFYLSVAVEGEVGAGDPVSFVHRDPEAVSIADLNRIYRGGGDEELLRRALRVPSLPAGWRRRIDNRLTEKAAL